MSVDTFVANLPEKKRVLFSIDSLTMTAAEWRYRGIIWLMLLGCYSTEG